MGECPFKRGPHLSVNRCAAWPRTENSNSFEIAASLLSQERIFAILARESAVGVNTIRRAEVAENGTSLTAAKELAIRRALELAGVEFIDENGGGPGVRLRKPPQGKQRK